MKEKIFYHFKGSKNTSDQKEGFILKEVEAHYIQ